MGHMLLAILVVACSGGGTEPIAEGTPDPEAEDEAAAEPFERKDGFAVSTTYLRSHPTTERRIEDPDNPGKKIGTYVATIYRGNALTVVEEQGEFIRVELQDGSGDVGWLQGKRVTTAEGAKLATIKEPTKTFSRPELLSVNTSLKLDPGAVLIVTQDQGKFVEVDYPRSQWSSASTWVLADSLVLGERDIEAAQLITKTLYMREDDPEKAKLIEELAREEFAGNTLLDLLDEPEPEPEPAPEPEEAVLTPAPE